ncbi:MAG: M23 family metallopeptidase, partial [Chitinophagaceae bacterium]
MKKIIIPALLTAFVIGGCSPAATNIFGKRTPLEKYEDKLEASGLENTPEGRQWLAASERALHSPVVINLPYRQAGNFSLERPQALGLKFSAKQGERLHFDFDKKDSASFVLYAELYKQDATGKATLLQSPDTNTSEFNYDVPESGTYVLKIQPQLYRVGLYSLSIAVGPSLGFPVADKKAYIGSIWGDVRDGGKRSHEGVDIFAPKRTPAIAAADGYIVGVREGGLGGKTVWLRPEGQNISLYYAHLDEQLVREGQSVKKGDTVGLVGNTGNAKYTPSHLHFGVYGYGGAINPFPFVNREVKTAAVVTSKKLTDQLRFIKDVKTNEFAAEKNTLLWPLAITAKGYIVELPDGQLVQTSFSVVQSAAQPIKKSKATLATALYKTPSPDATSGVTIAAGTSISVMGYFNGYAFVRSGEAQGWILES